MPVTAGREGELIFSQHHALDRREKKPTRRLWLQSMTADSIRAGFEHLRSEQEMRTVSRRRAIPGRRATGLSASTPTRALTSFNFA